MMWDVTPLIATLVSMMGAGAMMGPGMMGAFNAWDGGMMGSGPYYGMMSMMMGMHMGAVDINYMLEMHRMMEAAMPEEWERYMESVCPMHAYMESPEKNA